MTEPTDDLTGETVRVDGTDRTVGPELGSGHEGTVYGLEGVDDRVIKAFPEDKQPSKERKVSAMVDAQPVDPNRDATGLPAFAWPTGLVHDPNSGAFLGYAMPKIDLGRFEEAQKHARDALEWDDSDIETRAETAFNLAATMGLLHAQDNAVGDLNHDNVLVSGTHVTLIDCDGFHVGGSTQEYPSTMYPVLAPLEPRHRSTAPADGLLGPVRASRPRLSNPDGRRSPVQRRRERSERRHRRDADRRPSLPVPRPRPGYAGAAAVRARLRRPAHGRSKPVPAVFRLREDQTPAPRLRP